MRRASLQVKFGLSYILVIAAVLVFMNTYPLIVSENLVVRSKQTTLQSSVSVMVTALSGLEELSEENVASAMTLVEDTGISRILVTDAAGRILYDTRETDGAVGRYGLYTEIVQALRGYDAFYADFTDGAFRSRAASPGWGVRIVFAGRSPLYFPAASAFSASASSTAPAHGAFLPSRALQTSAALSPNPGPASKTVCLSANQRRSASASCGWMPPLAAVRQPQAQHSGVRESTSWITGSTLARYTSPAPPRKAPSVQSAAAPR